VEKVVYFLLVLLTGSIATNAQRWLDYRISPRGDTINRLDANKHKQGPWWIRYEEVRGEPGFEEEGIFLNNNKEGLWRKYSLMGDLIAEERYKSGFRNGTQRYYNRMGQLIREEGWMAVDPKNPYDTIFVPDLLHPEWFTEKIIRHESAEVKNGIWKFYDPITGDVQKTEVYKFGQLETDKSPIRIKKGKD
jgi:antitoxin component YwqK of YwqJK toxin-antitoxin module